MTEFTPSSWNYEERNDSSCGRPCTPNGCHDSHPSGIYDIIGPDTMDWPDDTISTTNEGHARLISSAPELLTALEALVAPLKRPYGVMDNPWFKIEVRAARDAIAKARGP